MAAGNNLAPSMQDELANPKDLVFQRRRELAIEEYLKMNERQLDKALRFQMQQPAPRDNAHKDITKSVLNELMGASYVPQTVKTILGSGAGGGLNDGSPLIRQDLEPILSQTA